MINNENFPVESSPLISFRGKTLNCGENEPPRTPKSHEKRYNNFRNSPRNSPRRSTPNSPKISRLPIRSGANVRFSIKELRLPPDETVTNCGTTAVRVTPEKLMEELRDEVKKKKKMETNLRIIDEEISLSVSNCILEDKMEKLSDDDNDNDDHSNFTLVKPRMSMRNKTAVIVDAPDLVYEDPLEVARQTLANTRANSGYKHCKLIYTTERREMARSNSPEPAFSQKTGITRHFLNIDEEEEEEERVLKFDRVLKLFESPTETSFEGNLEMKPRKSCLKQSTAKPKSVEPLVTTTQIVQIKRICYEGDENRVTSEIGGSPMKKRRIGNGAKRLKKID